MGQPLQNSRTNSWLLANQGYSADYETLGLKGSFNSINPGFASAAASPLAYYKFYVGEGGLRVPMIIAGGPVAIKNQFSRASAYVTDITPTILALTGVEHPQTTNGARYAGRKIERMIGRSLVPLLEGSAESIYGPEDAVGFELAGHGALFMDDYKIVFNRGTQGDSQWRLFNIQTDPGETNDLSAENPAQLQLMLGRYQHYVADNNVLPIPDGYRFEIQTIFNGLHHVYRDNILIFILLFLLILPFWVVYKSKLKS
jgi:arylsulfatase/uncharacterized sulfatase